MDASSLEKNYGLVDAGYVPKPAYGAFAAALADRPSESRRPAVSVRVLRRGIRRVSRRGVALAITSSEAGRVRARGELRMRLGGLHGSSRARRLAPTAPAAASLPGRGTAKVVLRLGPRARRLLRRARSATLTVRVAVFGPVGDPGRARLRLRLHR